MVRIATVNDAEQLNILNDEFNGESETSIDNIRNSLMNNKQEVVIVADEDDMLVGFVCVQLKKSFCYDEYMPEITEVYVKPAYRKRGLASEMITFAEAYCSKNYPLHQYELLTGQENLVAQTVYFVIPFVMIFVGYILKKHPVKDMNSGNGYNTPSSRKSQEHWDYAQSIAPNIFIGIGKTLGLVEIVLCISLLFLNISAQSTVFAGVAVGIIFLFFGFYKTETGIKNKFLDDKF